MTEGAVNEDDNRYSNRRQLLKALALPLSLGLVGCTISEDTDESEPNETESTTEDEDTDVETDSNDVAAQRVRPAEGDPRYWEFDGKPRLLLGATDTDSLFQMGKNPDELRTHLDELKRAEGNYVRNTMNSRREDEGDVHPFKMLENGKYDLSEWNEEFWKRFKLLLSETAKREIVVQIELWDGHNYQSRRDDTDGFVQWDRHPMNPKNNINYTAEETALPEKWTKGYRTETHPVLLTIPPENNDQKALAVQERFISEILNHTFDYNHVLYVIQNESWAPQTWSNYWADFIREKAAKQDKEVYIGDMRFSPTVSPVLEHGFDFAELSQSGQLVGQNHFDAIASAQIKLTGHPANSVKQYGSDEIDWTDGEEEGIARLWRTIFAGQAAVRNHRPPFGIGLNNRAKNQIRSLRIVMEMLNMLEVQPHQYVKHLLRYRGPDECYLMADPGRIYGLYFPNDGHVNLDVSAIEGPSYVRWLATDKSEWASDWTKAQIGSDEMIELNALGDHRVAIVANRPLEVPTVTD